jgi:predicted nucleic acid-binding protein
MTGYLLDTNIVSELVKSKPEPLVTDFISSKPLDSLHLTEITFAEIRFGIERQPDPLKRSSLLSWLDHQLRPMFEGRVLIIDEDVILRWRLMIEEGRKQGRTYSQPDLFIAACAAVHGLTVVTRNDSDFAGTGVGVANPWKPQKSA